MRIDHVVVAASDLAAGAAEVGRRVGREPMTGGRHDGLGTQNMLVPLRDGFVEIVAVVDPGEAAQSDLGRLLAAPIGAAGDWLMAWCVRVDDANAVAGRLGLETTEVGRGGRTAVLAGFPEALRCPTLPFFIQRADGPPRPGDADRPSIDWVEVAGDESMLADWLDGASLPVRVSAGEPALLRVGIGERTL